MTEAIRHAASRSARIGVIAIAVLALGGCINTSRPQLMPGSDVAAYPYANRSVWEAILDPCTWTADTTARRTGLACGASRDSVQARAGARPPQKIP